MKKTWKIILYVLGGIIGLGLIVYGVGVLLLSLTSCDNNATENPEITDFCEGESCKDSYPWAIEDLYGSYSLVGFNKKPVNLPVTLTIKEDSIGAKFCNDMGSDNYSIDGKIIHVRNMVQNLMLCDSEELMEYENKFDLSDAKISLVERSLRFMTSNGDIYDFFKKEESVENNKIVHEEENIDDCKRYFDGCNRCTTQDDGERICTEEACEKYQEAYCADEQYNEFLEAIKSSGEQPQGKNDSDVYENHQYGIELGLSSELEGGKIIEEDRNDVFPHHVIIFLAKDDTATADETGIDGYREKFTVWVVPVENYEDAMIGFTEDNILGKNNKYYFFETIGDPLDTNHYYTHLLIEDAK